jgi:hypothetical protein
VSKHRHTRTRPARHKQAPAHAQTRARRKAHRHVSTRPRYGRLAAAGGSLLVTATAVLGGIGVLPGGGTTTADLSAAGGTPSDSAKDDAPAARPDRDTSPPNRSSRRNTGPAGAAPKVEGKAKLGGGTRTLPDESGDGYRVVFSESAQRVWLVDDADEVVRTYLVSGSVYDNLEPGTYEVYSRSEEAVGIDDSGTMEYFVRFTEGDNDAAIGFHDIPVDDGEPLQSLDELGTPQSHGCIRQRESDAVALWEFAPIGTTVVVV